MSVDSERPRLTVVSSKNIEEFANMLTARVLIILQVLWICGIVPLLVAYGWSVDSNTENAEISPFTGKLSFLFIIKLSIIVQ